MRGIERCDKEEALQLLREGKSPVQISKQLNVPLSTVTTWLKVLREEKREKIKSSSVNVQSVLMAQKVNECEAVIINTISPFMTFDITDEEWMMLQDKISCELKKLLAFHLESE